MPPSFIAFVRVVRDGWSTSLELPGRAAGRLSPVRWGGGLDIGTDESRAFEGAGYDIDGCADVFPQRDVLDDLRPTQRHKAVRVSCAAATGMPAIPLSRRHLDDAHHG